MRSKPLQNTTGLVVIVLVSVSLFVLSAVAGGTIIILNQSNNNRTFDVLTDSDASASDLAAISDQDQRNVINNLPDNLGIATGFAGTAAPPLPNGSNTMEVAVQGIQDLVLMNQGAPQDYFSNPGSSWNSNNGADRPSDGTTPVGEEELTGGSGTVQINLRWDANVDLDLHVEDPCGVEIFYGNTSNTCQGSTGTLDVDNIPGGSGSAENIFWPAGGAPSGSYDYWVRCFSRCDSESAAFVLTRIVDGVRSTNSGSLSSSGQDSRHFTFSR